jgi:hypothetical protein
MDADDAANADVRWQPSVLGLEKRKLLEALLQALNQGDGGRSVQQLVARVRGSLRDSPSDMMK